MLQARPDPPSLDETALPTSWCGLFWAVFALDVVAVVAMVRMGTWLDSGSLLSTVTLGGNHLVVLGLAAAALALLVVLAPLTHGFVRANRVQRVLLPVAAMLSIAALAGVLFVVGVVVGVALLFRPQPRMTIDMRHRRR